MSYLEMAKRFLAEKEKTKEIKLQDPHKEFHQLLITTFTEIDQYRFTDFPLTWAKKNGYIDISFKMFKAETNLDAAILDKHLNEAKYWSNKLINAHKELFAVYQKNRKT